MSQKRILVIGAGFAGMWTALGARRVIDSNTSRDESSIEVAVVAPEETLVMRPRLYENNPESMTSSLTDLFAATGVRFIKGTVDAINTIDRKVSVEDATGAHNDVSYDRLVLAAGSRLVRPNIPGLRDHTFSADSIGEAVQLDEHLKGLSKLPSSPARNTVVVCGGGFTGIELAAELPARLRSILGEDVDVRVVVVDRSAEVGSGLGPGPQPVILEAFKSLGVETKLGVAVTAVDAGGVSIASGERIETLTAVWTGGMVASPLTAQIPAEKDNLGRLHVDKYLRVPSHPEIFATGDTALAATDDEGHYAMMSCQHAMVLGRAAGHNVAADMLGLSPKEYSQDVYATCLDLGPQGAVVTYGWDRKVVFTGTEGKEVKQWINRSLIYPPKADTKEAFAAANPDAKIPTLDPALLKVSA
ncbi:related to NADH dehydrogenase, FAD-containing subunit [Cephalotrichum gorgonifer]|uniref:Related to NADH dehydrogenase, FAD-containing subunit n=1 Tax=Cephalotrichum gorgonifer TaxID=2041049 RepID=A0AAE8N4C0_9PEZI|nr:related to NADH dehydrogenase, FAD-containing subunit [Cephalotrichum gorgonifer]